MDTLQHIKSCFTPVFKTEDSQCRFFMNLPIVVVELTTEGQVLFVNNAITRITGFKPEELIGVNWWEKFFPDTYYQQVKDYFETSARRDILEFEMTMVARDWTPVTLQWNSYNEYGEEGDIKTHILFGIDVTGMKRTEKALEESEERFRQMAEASFEGIFIHDGLHILNANTTFARMFGYEQFKAEILHDLNVLFTPESWKIFEEKASRWYEQPYEIEGVKRDGTVFPIKVCGKKIPYMGRWVHVAAIQNLTGQKRRESETRQELDLRVKIMDTNPAAILLTDKQGKIIFANKRVEEILGMNQSEIEGRLYNDPAWQVFDCDGSRIPDDMRVFSRIKRTGETILDSCYIIRRQDGAEKTVSVSGAPLSFGNQIDGVVITYLDTSERVKYENVMTSLYKELADRSKEMSKLNTTLEQERNLLRTLMETVPMGIIVYDEVGNLLFSNPVAREILKIPYEETRLINGSLTGIEGNIAAIRLKDCNGNPITPEESVFNQARNSSKPVLNVCRSLTEEDGTRKFYSVNSASILDKAGRTVGVISTFEEVTRIVEFQKSLQESEERFRQLADAASEAIIVSDEKEIITFNKSFTEMFGYSEEELRNISEFSVFFTRESWEEAAIYFYERIEGSREVDARRKNGTVFPVLLQSKCSLLRGKPVHIITMLDLTMLRKAEADLRWERDLLNRLFEISPIGIILADNEGKFIFANKTAEETMGLVRSEITSRTYNSPEWTFTDCSGKPMSEEELGFTIVKKTKQPLYDLCEIIQWPDGRKVHLNFNLAPLLNDRGEVEMVIVTFEDITERIAAENELRDSEERFRQLADLSSEAILIHDKGRVINYNKAGIRIFGYDPDALPEFKDIYDLHFLFTPDSWNRIMQNYNAGGEEPFEVEGVKKDGTVFPVRFHARNFSYREKNVRAITVRDLTEQKKVEKELSQYNEFLHREREFLDKVMTTSPMGIILINSMGNIYFANEYASKILNVPREELTRRNVNSPEWELTDCEGKQLRDEDMPFYRVINTRQAVVDSCFSVVTGEGKRILLSFNTAPLLNENNEIEGVINIFLDITDRVNTQRELENLTRTLEERARELAESNASLERFAFIASHDLKEPLNVILGYARLIISRYAGKLDPEADEFMQYIVDDAMRMQRLINGLLALSRVSTHGKPFEPVDANNVLRDALINLEARIEENEAIITFDNLPVIYADQAQFTQVFQNLISNAIKYRKPDETPRIHVSARRREGEWLFSITDNGIGIEQKHFDRIFKIFQHIKAGPEAASSGIGLAIVEKIVKRHGGTVWLESEPSVGSTFYFTIPALKR